MIVEPKDLFKVIYLSCKPIGLPIYTSNLFRYQFLYFQGIFPIKPPTCMDFRCSLDKEIKNILINEHGSSWAMIDESQDDRIANNGNCFDWKRWTKLARKGDVNIINDRRKGKGVPRKPTFGKYFRQTLTNKHQVFWALLLSTPLVFQQRKTSHRFLLFPNWK